MEHIGIGIRRMKDAMFDEDLDAPKFEEEEEFFKVTFKGQDFLNKHVKLNDRQSSFLESKKSTVTVTEYVKIFGVTRNTARADLNYLVDKKLFKKFKKDKSYVYRRL